MVVGLEIHAELNTETKAFCACKNTFGEEPNTHVCPTCLGMPGALPVLNKQAVIDTVLVGLSFGCNINERSYFERKNYFYPDLAKGYQITQLNSPICVGGGIHLSNGRFIRFNRIQLEEDAGKLIHNDETKVDFNRCGVPLIEMVTEPDLRSVSEVNEFLNILKQTLMYTGVCNCRMERGELRFDVNLSVREKGASEYGARVEMKNLNSFRNVGLAVTYEFNRQTNILEAGKIVDSETRGWNDALGETFTMRTKEDVSDYRYFRDPDLPDIIIKPADIESIRRLLPEPISAKLTRYSAIGLEDSVCKQIASDKYIAEFFDAVLKYYYEPREVANWILKDVLKIYDGSIDLTSIITPENLASIIRMVAEGRLTRANGRVLFEEVVDTHEEPEKLIKKLGIAGLVEESEIVAALSELMKLAPNVVTDYKSNPDKVINYAIGYVMQKTRGRAKADKIKEIIEEVFV